MERGHGGDDSVVATSVSFVVVGVVGVVGVVVVMSHSQSGNKPTGPLLVDRLVLSIRRSPTFALLRLLSASRSLLEFRLSRSHSLVWSWRWRCVRIMLLTMRTRRGAKLWLLR